MRYSVVVPAYNEADNLPILHERLRTVMSQLCGAHEWELVVTDDGSSDSTWEVIQTLAHLHPQVHGIRFSRNFGHHLAVTAGLDAARGKRVVVMDADLQHRPEDIPRFAAALDAGADVAYGRAQERAHGLVKTIFSKTFLYLLNRFGGTQVELDSSLFRAMDRLVVDAVRSCREHDRYVVGLISWVGFRQVAVPITYAPRLSGQAKYSFWKSLWLAVATIVSFSTVPLRLAIVLGVLFSLLSFVQAVEIVVQRLFFHVTTSGYTSLFAGMMLLGGVTLLMLGVIGEYLSHVVNEVKARPLYVIRETTSRRD